MRDENNKKTEEYKPKSKIQSNLNEFLTSDWYENKSFPVQKIVNSYASRDN